MTEEPIMTDDIREQIALVRYKLISPVLAEPARVQNAYFREQAERFHDMPHYGPKRYAVSSFKRWLRMYREGGFAGLRPKARADLGRPRRITGDTLDAVRAMCRAHPTWSIKLVHEELVRGGHLGDPPVCYTTLARTIRAEGLLPVGGRTDTRKRYEAPELNDLWVVDFMHGPKVTVGNRSLKAILCAVIDDHTRMIVGWSFSPYETIGQLTVVLKDAFATYGLPRRLYADNGAAFSAELLVKACAQARIALVHSKPYDSPSRGKIERFFRTVRERFLATVDDGVPLDELNQAFAAWLADDYHRREHGTLKERPIDRYHVAASRAEIRHLARAELDEIFLVRHERMVNNDATISFRSRIYEVPSAYIRQRVEIRHPVDDDQELALYDNGVRVARLKLVDVKENARTFAPTSVDTPLSYASAEVRT
jgi:transposase InsO family protein